MLETLGGPSSLVIAASTNEASSVKAKESLCYLAPEQTGYFDHITRTDHRTDLYSLGVLFWTLVVGHGAMPFEGSTLEMLHAVANKKPLVVTDTRKEVPNMLSLIIDKVRLFSHCRQPPFTSCSYYPKTQISDTKGDPQSSFNLIISNFLVAHMDSNKTCILVNIHSLSPSGTITFGRQ